MDALDPSLASAKQISMSDQKRQFPYYSDVPDVELKKQALEHVNPGFERNEPRTFEAPVSVQEAEQVHSSA